jgi:hypothetical protein
MENTSVRNRTLKASERKVRSRFSSDQVKKSQIPGDLDSEVDENFINYLSWNGLVREENLLVLSSTLHYYIVACSFSMSINLPGNCQILTFFLTESLYMTFFYFCQCTPS